MNVKMVHQISCLFLTKIKHQGDEMNLELSAATKNKICTYCVTGPEAAQQVFKINLVF